MDFERVDFEREGFVRVGADDLERAHLVAIASLRWGW